MQVKARHTQLTKQKSKENDASAALSDPFFQVMMNLMMQPIGQNSAQLTPTEGQSVLTTMQLSGMDIPLITADMLQGQADANPLLNPQLASFGAEVLDAAAQLAELTAQQEAAAPLQSQGAPILPHASASVAGGAQMPEVLQSLAPQVLPQEQSGQPSGETPMLTGRSEAQTQSRSIPVEVLPEDTLSAQREFSQAVSKARQALESSGGNVREDADVQLSQQPAKADAATPFEPGVKDAESSEQTCSTEEIPQSLKQNLALGKSEFTLRLRPESLGEITVKLIEEDGKTTLQLTTASAHTAKLINHDIDALRETMAPLNVEVRYAVTSAQDSQGGAMPQMDMSSQQFMHHRFTRQQSFSHGTRSGVQGQNLAGGAAQITQAAAVTARLSSRLDAYV